MSSCYWLEYTPYIILVANPEHITVTATEKINSVLAETKTASHFLGAGKPFGKSIVSLNLVQRNLTT